MNLLMNHAMIAIGVLEEIEEATKEILTDVTDAIDVTVADKLY